MMKHESVVWLACAVDSEGCIAAYWYSGHSLDQRIAIANDSLAFIQHARRLTKCGVIVPHTRRSNGKMSYELRILQKNEVRKILSLIRPFLIIKREQAELMLKILDFRYGQHHNLNADKIIPFVKQIRNLNR